MISDLDCKIFILTHLNNYYHATFKNRSCYQPTFEQQLPSRNLCLHSHPKSFEEFLAMLGLRNTNGNQQYLSNVSIKNNRKLHCDACKIPKGTFNTCNTNSLTNKIGKKNKIDKRCLQSENLLNCGGTLGSRYSSHLHIPTITKLPEIRRYTEDEIFIKQPEKETPDYGILPIFTNKFADPEYWITEKRRRNEILNSPRVSEKQSRIAEALIDRTLSLDSMKMNQINKEIMSKISYDKTTEISNHRRSASESNFPENNRFPPTYADILKTSKEVQL